MTKKEELLEVLREIPEELIDNAYALLLGERLYGLHANKRIVGVLQDAPSPTPNSNTECNT
jgi:hypothetical protein